MKPLKSMLNVGARWCPGSDQHYPIMNLWISSWVLQGLYYEKMIGCSPTNFADMVTIGERVENGLKSGKIIDTTAPQTTNKRSYGCFAKKKEGEANVVTAGAHPQYQSPMTHMSYYLYPYVATTQYQQPPCQCQPQKGNQQPTPN